MQEDDKAELLPKPSIITRIFWSYNSKIKELRD